MALNNHVEKFTLDMAPGGIAPVLNVSQGDIGRKFTADIFWGGASYDVSGLTAEIRGRKRDNTVFNYVASLSGTTASFETKEQMTIIPGNVDCELVFFDSGSREIGTANFTIIVEEAPFDPNAPSESIIPGIEDLIEDVLGGDVGAAVDAWLDEHPEATTTVQDGSLTYKKLVNGTLNFVTPEMFGAVGDGTTDDTQAFADAFDTGKLVVGTFGKTYAVQNISGLSEVKLKKCNIKYIGTNGARCFKFDGSSVFVYADNCKFDGNGRCLRFFTCEDSTVIADKLYFNNCEFFGVQRQAVYMPLNGNVAIVNNCYFHDMGDRDTITSSGGVRIGYTSDIAGENRKFEFILCTGNKCENILQTPQTSSGENANAIDISGKYCVVANNYFETIDAQAFYIKSYYCDVHGNLINNCGLYSNGAVAIKDTDNGVFYGNQLHGHGSLGLLRATNKLLVSDCEFVTDNTATHAAAYAADDYLLGFNNVTFNNCKFEFAAGNITNSLICYYGDAEFNSCDFYGFVLFEISATTNDNGNFTFNSCNIESIAQTGTTLFGSIVSTVQTFVKLSNCEIVTGGYLTHPRRKLYARGSNITCTHVDNKVSATYGTALQNFEDCELHLSGNQVLASGDIKYSNCKVFITEGSIYNSVNVEAINTYFALTSGNGLIRYTNAFDTSATELKFLNCVCEGADRLDSSASGHTYASCIVVGCILPTVSMATGSGGTVYKVRDNVQL